MGVGDPSKTENRRSKWISLLLRSVFNIEKVSDPVHSVLEDRCKKCDFGITKVERSYGRI